jgi:copper chaperone CopZ
MKTINLVVENMNCQSCVKKIESELEIDGVKNCQIDLPSQSVKVEFNPEELSSLVIKSKLTEVGFPVSKMSF